jgi:hypothetical protein
MRSYLTVGILAFSLVFAACSGGKDNPAPNPSQTYTVTFVTNGGNALEPVTVNSGTAIQAPTATRNYYELEGWYRDGALSNRASFPLTVASNISLYAKWEQVEYRFEGSTVNFEGLYNNSVFWVKADLSSNYDNSPTYSQLELANFNDRGLARIGDTKEFWITGLNKKTFTLRAIGSHGNIWIADEIYYGNGDDAITQEDAEAAAVAFDKVYPLVTNLIGYEYGGEPGGRGGIDGDLKIQILVMPGGGGSFWPINLCPKSFNPASNEAEMFYIGGGRFSSLASVTLSMAHEFAHLVLYSSKFIKHNSLPSAWFEETLAVMVEDALEYALTKESGIPYFRDINGYNVSAATQYNKVFGSYLMRNYGGPQLLREIHFNDKVGVESITDALKKFDPALTFEKVLQDYAQIFIYGANPPRGAKTINKEVIGTINGIDYTLRALDITQARMMNPDTGQWVTGPYFFNLTFRDMEPYSISIHQIPEWQNKSGSLTVTVPSSNNPNIVQYLLLK